eukprot:4992106-Amphidinium_carterae.2
MGMGTYCPKQQGNPFRVVMWHRSVPLDTMLEARPGEDFVDADSLFAFYASLGVASNVRSLVAEEIMMKLQWDSQRQKLQDARWIYRESLWT